MRRLKVGHVSVLAAVALFVAGFIGVKALTGTSPVLGGDPDAIGERATGGPINPPGPDVYPEPGATPVTSELWWYIPYENKERDEPKFRGTISGMAFGLDDGSRIQCTALKYDQDGATLIGDDALEAISSSPLALSLQSLPAGVQVFEVKASFCDDGTPYSLSVGIEASSRLTGVNAGGTGISVHRLAWSTSWPNLASESRWSEGTIGGRPAAFMGPVIGTIGPTMVFVLDEETGGSTRILAHSATLEFVINIAEALYTK